MRENLNSDDLIRMGFTVSRFWDERGRQFRLKFEKEGYDGTILVLPVMQVAATGIEWMTAEQQIEEFSSIEDLWNHNIGDWGIFLNDVNHHITTFRYRWQLESFIDLTEDPFIDEED